MPISDLELTDFTVFKSAKFTFVPGINVLIGENGTGKSHVLKAMYAVIRANSGEPRKLSDKFTAIFRPDPPDLARLKRRGAKEGWALRVFDKQHRMAQMTWRGNGNSSTVGGSCRMLAQPTLFVPPREVLAILNGFVAAYEARELDFDETYYDICKALGAAPLRGPRAAAIADLLAPLEQILGGKVMLRGNRFFVQQGDSETEAHLLAEGLRKIACLAYLVANGALTRDSVVFLDEPEASLNPRLVAQLVLFVRALARAGVQVFLASHDFLLIHRLSQPAEHHVEPAVPIRFFSLYRPEPGAPVEVEAAATLVDIEHNAILDEFARYYDDERAYSEREMQHEPIATQAKKSTTKKPPAKKSTPKKLPATAKKPTAKRTKKRG
jgi:energy-coupling factor transporter ATP-binding protein EcfA2